MVFFSAKFRTVSGRYRGLGEKGTDREVQIVRVWFSGRSRGSAGRFSAGAIDVAVASSSSRVVVGVL